MRTSRVLQFFLSFSWFIYFVNIRSICFCVSLYARIFVDHVNEIKFINIVEVIWHCVGSIVEIYITSNNMMICIYCFCLFPVLFQMCDKIICSWSWSSISRSYQTCVRILIRFTLIYILQYLLFCCIIGIFFNIRNNSMVFLKFTFIVWHMIALWKKIYLSIVKYQIFLLKWSHRTLRSDSGIFSNRQFFSNTHDNLMDNGREVWIMANLFLLR